MADDETLGVTATTGWLEAWREGDEEAGKRLFAASYNELRRLANWHMERERPGHTLQPTALVNELYLKLFGSEPVEWQSRAHFFAVAAQQIRRLLIDHARIANAAKRNGGQMQMPLTEIGDTVATPAALEPADLIDLHEALDRLAALDERAAKIVEMRFFGGLSTPDTAEALGISPASVKRDFEFARAWLSDQLSAGRTPR